MLGSMFGGLSKTANAATAIYVPDDYLAIQAAVNAASSGDTIIVRDGTYTENVDVNKQLIIQSENGAGSTIVQAANPNDHVFEVTADYVTISGFTVKGTTGLGIAGIYLGGNSLDNVGQCHILDNIIANNTHGIELYKASSNTLISNTFIGDGLHVVYSYQNTVSNNTVNGKALVYLENASNALISDTANTGQVVLVNCDNITIRDLNISNTSIGIELWGTTNSLIENNTVSNSLYGINLHSSDNNTLSNNYASLNNDYGIWLGSSINNTLSNNAANSNFNGISLNWCTDNDLTSNITSSNNNYGIILVQSSNNTLTGNTISNNGCGIFLNHSSDNTHTTNTISNNNHGIRLAYSDSNAIFLNNFMNIQNIHWDLLDSTNIWKSQDEMTYTYNGNTYTNHLGNYWDDYTGTDADGDGIGEAPYSINSDNDNDPLMEPFENYGIPYIRTPINGIDFGYVALGSSLDKTTTIYNDGDGTLTIGNMTRGSGSSDFAYVGPSTPFDIGGGGSQDITIRFEPSSPESRSATFNVNSNDPDEPQAQFNTSGNGHCIPGDANLNGVVNSGDITVTIKIIFGKLVDLKVTSDGCCNVTVGAPINETVLVGETKTFYNIDKDTSVTLTADDSDPSCAFDSWTGGVDDPDSATTFVNMNVDKCVTANCTIAAPVP